MKKSLIFIAVLSLVIAGTTEANCVLTTKERGRISVNTSADTEIAPDIAEISFAIKTSDTKSIQKATLENNEISKKVLLVLETDINKENGDYIKTSDFNAAPIYTYINSKKTFEKYEVSNKITVRTKNIDKLGKMIDNAIKSGATNVDNLSFSLSNYDSQCNDLITKATKKAKERADVIAKALSTQIEGLSNISSSCSTNNNNMPRLYMAKNMIADVAAESASSLGSTTISNGVIKVIANVNASFFVE